MFCSRTASTTTKIAVFAGLLAVYPVTATITAAGFVYLGTLFIWTPKDGPTPRMSERSLHEIVSNTGETIGVIAASPLIGALWPALYIGEMRGP
jgi:hypothetical protein